MGSPFHSLLTDPEMLLQCTGCPIRVSIFDPEYPDCLGRYLGVLAEVSSERLLVDCVDLPERLPQQARVTLEIRRQGSLFWCHSRFSSLTGDRGSHQLCLQWPASVQSTQRRAFPRVDVHLPVFYGVLGRITAEPGFIIDIGAGGIALQGAIGLSPQEKITLVFSLGSGLFFQDITADVVRSACSSTGVWVSGLSFRGLSPEQKQLLEQWVDQRLQEIPETD